VKLGIVGKGGVGKTTVSALLARSYAADGARVLAIDTDSNPNLGVSLGLSVPEMEALPVLPRALIVGTGGNSTSEELVRDYGRTTPSGVSLLSAIKVNEAGAGCMCGGHATVRSLLGTAIEEQADVAIVDMEAGLEHLSRSGGTLAHADVLLVVMEPTRKSVLTASRTVVLAEELGIPRTVAVGNKARTPEDAEFFRTACAEYGVPLAGVISFAAAVVAADLAGGVVDAEQGEQIMREIAELRAFLGGVPVG
jgi:CO dehydrogenase maturation factor